MTAAPERSALPVATSCAHASESAARCAAECLGRRRLHDSGRCSEWCLVASRALGACADILRQMPYEAHRDFALALGRAGRIAAEECAIECGLHVDEISLCATARDACRAAARDLRLLIHELEQEGTSAS